MEDTELARIEIQVSSPGATEEEVDRMTRQLLAALRETEVQSAELARGESAPAGSKGDPMTIGSIAVQLLPSVLPGVIGAVQAWATQGKGRTVKYKAEGIEFEGPPEELHLLLRRLDKQRKK